MNQTAVTSFSSTDIHNLALGALLVLVLPVVAGLMLLIFGRKLPRKGDWLGLASIAGSFLASVYLFLMVWNQGVVHVQVPWFSLGGIESENLFTAGLYLDNLSVLMLALITFISLLVQVFSITYMHGERKYHHYYGYLGIFTFSMLGIVLADNLLLLFIFWELVGFSSYLLIGFWYEKDSAAQASKKAFLFNRVGDIGFLLGIFAFYSYFQTFDLVQLKIQIGQALSNSPHSVLSTTGEAIPYGVLTLAGLGLFCGCIGKSAQFPLQVWLPDAMEGPTPVSALIHAATMVAAGVYLVSRCFPFFTEDALLVIACIGAFTALLGAVAASAQYDIKKILAYSTISQLGYMVMGMGVGAHDASLMHLVTHAFFKAALFLNAGIIIHAMHKDEHRHNNHLDAQDIRNMGGMRKILPVTYYSYLLAAAALIGIPFFSGFLSKDAILTGALRWAVFKGGNGNILYYIIPAFGFLSVFLTAFYMTRHCLFVFFGRTPLNLGPEFFRESKNKEASWLLLTPVIILSVLSLAIFFSINPFNYATSWVLTGLSWEKLNLGASGLSGELVTDVNNFLKGATFISFGTAGASVLLAIIGILIGRRNYKIIKLLSLKGETPEPVKGFEKIAYRNFYLDSFYNQVLVNPFLRVARGVADLDKNFIDYTLNNSGKLVVIFAKIIAWIDRKIIDGAVNFAAWLAGLVGKVGRLTQNGKIQTYYIFSLVGLVLLVLYILAF